MRARQREFRCTWSTLTGWIAERWAKWWWMLAQERNDKRTPKQAGNIFGLLILICLCHGTRNVAHWRGPMLNRFKTVFILLLVVVTFFSAAALRADVTGSV